MAPDTSPQTQAIHSRRRVLATLTAGTTGLVAVACGQGGTAGDAPGSQAKKDVTIRVVARTAQEADMWPIRIPQFMTAYPNIKVEPELYPSDIVGKISALVAAGSMGDVGHTHFSADRKSVV